jgi:hypothetical protein
MRWIRVGPADQPGTSIVLHRPAATPGVTDERRTIFQVTLDLYHVTGALPESAVGIVSI